MERISIALEIYKDISRQIQFADSKATVLLALNIATALIMVVAGKEITIGIGVFNLLLSVIKNVCFGFMI